MWVFDNEMRPRGKQRTPIPRSPLESLGVPLESLWSPLESHWVPSDPRAFPPLLALPPQRPSRDPLETLWSPFGVPLESLGVPRSPGVRCFPLAISAYQVIERNIPLEYNSTVNYLTATTS